MLHGIFSKKLVPKTFWKGYQIELKFLNPSCQHVWFFIFLLVTYFAKFFIELFLIHVLYLASINIIKNQFLKIVLPLKKVWKVVASCIIIRNYPKFLLDS